MSLLFGTDYPCMGNELYIMQRIDCLRMLLHLCFRLYEYNMRNTSF